ncbi:unnamed protein product, partial [marine sediment metagenome]
MNTKKWDLESERNKTKQKIYRDRKNPKEKEEIGKYIYLYNPENLSDFWKMENGFCCGKHSELMLHGFSVSEGSYGFRGNFHVEGQEDNSFSFNELMKAMFFKEYYDYYYYDKQTGKQIWFKQKIDGI